MPRERADEHLQHFLIVFKQEDSLPSCVCYLCFNRTSEHFYLGDVISAHGDQSVRVTDHGAGIGSSLISGHWSLISGH